MPALLPDVDPHGLLEYSVVYTDRSLNHMSVAFQDVINHITSTLKQVYNAKQAIIVPGSGTFGMEAVARQFGTDEKCLVVRNGWFSYRWSEIFDKGRIASDTIVMKAQRLEQVHQSPFAPAAIDEVVNKILVEKPAAVFAPHVETSAGIILPDDYIRALADAVHKVGGIMVLDCIASGTIWVDMEKCGVDALISAPQKGWSGPPCCGLVMLSELGIERLEQTDSTSFAMDLRKWHQLMQTYENGSHAYHTTMPTDALRLFSDVIKETATYGFDKVCEQQWQLGKRVRALLADRHIPSVAADGFGAPGVVVSYTDDSDIHNGKKFKNLGMQIAAGVPLCCDEPDDYRSFRIGLFGLDKLRDIDGTVERLASVIDQLFS